MDRKAARSSARHRAKQVGGALTLAHPRSVAVPSEDVDRDVEADRPFEEGAHDAIDPDLRHRMISEAAYALYAKRGYVDGFDVDDWLAAEADVDHLVIGRASSAS